MEAYQDCLVRAISKDGMVNAVAVYTRALTERARQIHHTSPVATAALGRALAACSMMGNALKDSGASVTMQIKGRPHESGFSPRPACNRPACQARGRQTPAFAKSLPRLRQAAAHQSKSRYCCCGGSP